MSNPTCSSFSSSFCPQQEPLQASVGLYPAEKAFGLDADPCQWRVAHRVRRDDLLCRVHRDLCHPARVGCGQAVRNMTRVARQALAGAEARRTHMLEEDSGSIEGRAGTADCNCRVLREALAHVHSLVSLI